MVVHQCANKLEYVIIGDGAAGTVGSKMYQLGEQGEAEGRGLVIKSAALINLYTAFNYHIGIGGEKLQGGFDGDNTTLTFSNTNIITIVGKGGKIWTTSLCAFGGKLKGERVLVSDISGRVGGYGLGSKGEPGYCAGGGFGVDSHIAGNGGI